MAQSQWKSEGQFQAACVKWFDEYYPQQRERLIGIYNNPPNAIVGAKLISMGVRPGIADLLYFPDNPIDKPLSIIDYGDIKLVRVVWIELKILGKKQNPNQLLFEPMVKGFGHNYELVVEYLEDFKNVINYYQ